MIKKRNKISLSLVVLFLLNLVIYFIDSNSSIMRMLLSSLSENIYFEFWIKCIPTVINFIGAIYLIFLGLFFLKKECVANSKYTEKEYRIYILISKAIIIIPLIICSFVLVSYIKDIKNVMSDSYIIEKWNNEDYLIYDEGGSHKGRSVAYVVLEDGEKLKLTREQYKYMKKVKEDNRKGDEKNPKGNVYYLKSTKTVLKLESLNQ